MHRCLVAEGKAKENSSSSFGKHSSRRNRASDIHILAGASSPSPLWMKPKRILLFFCATRRILPPSSQNQNHDDDGRWWCWYSPERPDLTWKLFRELPRTSATHLQSAYNVYSHFHWHSCRLPQHLLRRRQRKSSDSSLLWPAPSLRGERCPFQILGGVGGCVDVFVPPWHFSAVHVREEAILRWDFVGNLI